MIKKIKENLARVIALTIPRAIIHQIIKNHNAKGYVRHYYSQEGEEIILKRYFNYQQTGFYVDIGAHHPQRFSNTYVLYELGWRGINIDANPASVQLFNKLRNEDINLEVAISDNNQEMNYFSFQEGALNTLDEERAKKIMSQANYKSLGNRVVITQTLSQVLDKYLIPSQKIDFFSIDTEGYDLKVLKGNNWKKYKPRVIVIESRVLHLDKIENDEVYIFLTNIGYKPFAKTYKSVFYSSEEIE
jgi:FkbM family methyltransferase